VDRGRDGLEIRRRYTGNREGGGLGFGWSDGNPPRNSRMNKFSSKAAKKAVSKVKNTRKKGAEEE